MSLISHVRLDRGSYYDEAQGVFAVPVGSKIGFTQTDKGIMLSNDGTTSNYVNIPIGLSIAMLLYIFYSWYSIGYLLSLLLMFPYFHDGQYYCTRNDLNSTIYPKRWRDSSTTSQAIFEFNYTKRVILSITSILILLTTLILPI